MNPNPRPQVVALAAAAMCCCTHAQSIDQFDVRRQGNDAVLQLRFANEIRFQRSFTTRSGDLTLIFYSLLSSTNTDLRSNQALRLGAAQGLPEMTLFDEAERGERERKLQLRSVEPVRLSVRAGQGNRSLEIVIEGAGAAVAARQAAPVRRTPTPAATPGTPAASALTPATLPESDRRFVIVLQSTTDPNATLDARVPRGLQNHDLFTTQRVVDGVTRYEVQLGHFTTRPQAEAVLKQLSDFPQAAIVAAAPVAAPPAVAAATPRPEAAPPAVAEPPVPTATEVETRAAELMASARAATAQGNHNAAIDALNELLNLPPNSQTRSAQELIGIARARSGDLARARIEFQTYLQLYPEGEGSERVRHELLALPAAPPPVDTRPKAATETTTTGSASMYYYGGNGRVRSQDFKDSPIGGLPQVAGEAQLSPDKASQLLNDVDLTWRSRSADRDMRFVLRDSYTSDLERSDKSKNRLSNLYFDYKSLTDGYAVRLGRQSPQGGGVMGRFDGASASVLARPKLKLGAVAGVPADKFFESRRRFYGASIDADGAIPNVGVGLYAIQQTIDSEIDRRAVGLELRYFKGGASVFSQFDYDVAIKGLNIATVQGTWILEDNTVLNALYDRRALTMLALGNALTFADPTTGLLFTRLRDKLAGPPPITVPELRDQIKRTTPFVTQAQLGVTKPLNTTWSVGTSAQLTNIGAIPPVPEVLGFENGLPASGNIYTVSTQLIGLNLYSNRDTHVWSTSVISGPNLKGTLLSYNLSSVAWEVWQFEPSLQYYRDRTAEGNTSRRWTPGLRVTFRGWQRWALESSITYEIGKGTRFTPDASNPGQTVTTQETSNRVNYSLGARYEF